MNWHRFGAWGSYSWNRNLLPDPGELVKHFQTQKKLKIGLNFHDADGVKPDEDAYAAMKTALGLPDSFQDAIKFVPSNATYLEKIEDVAVGALKVDLDWTDYQQGEHNFDVSKTIVGLNPTVMLNRIRHDTPARRGAQRRGLVLSRFPGVGGHRFPVGFGGDQAHVWSGLQYLPYFTSTASNVGRGLRGRGRIMIPGRTIRPRRLWGGIRISRDWGV